MLYCTFTDANDLREKVAKHLPKIVLAVVARLHRTNDLQKFTQQINDTDKLSEVRLAQLVDTDRRRLNRILAELEDDLDRAVKRRLGDVYLRPSSESWR